MNLCMHYIEVLRFMHALYVMFVGAYKNIHIWAHKLQYSLMISTQEVLKGMFSQIAACECMDTLNNTPQDYTYTCICEQLELECDQSESFPPGIPTPSYIFLSRRHMHLHADSSPVCSGFDGYTSHGNRWLCMCSKHATARAIKHVFHVLLCFYSAFAHAVLKQ